ncbi:MAG: recombinase family protein [Phenylobacterium sp.]|uniref:recombinase family protein n=1 Tax=Phenylobacterium sp. TaxID=1871053 RepID=UPI001A315C92|nr:recombinase family protein [Phenylobacterium sp.]MBJ7408873.1 recombinase family protein [Phenylobacterium sp.]
MDAYIYIRFSTPRQEAGSSRERQEEVCRAYVQRMGWNLIEPVIADLGRSAWKGDHLKKGNLGKFADRLFAREIPRGSVVVVEELDRLSRQKARITKRWIEDVCDADFSIASAVSGRIYSKTSLDENLLAMMEILLKAEAAHDYVERLSRRAKASYVKRLGEARENGTAVGTVGPAWLKAVGKRPHVVWTPIPERTRIVREIFDMAVHGMAPWTIAKTFNDRQEPSFTGKAWERTAIVKIIRNRAVEGDYVVGEGKSQKPTGEVLVGYYGEPIVPLDVVAEARAMLERRRQQRNGKGRNSGCVNNLFGQSIRCGTCGGRMAQFGYQNRYLVCYEANRANRCDQKATFHYRPFEAAALDRLLPLALDETFFRQAEKSNHVGLEIAEAQKALRDAQAEAERAYDMWDRTQSEIAERRFHDAEGRVTALKSRLADLERKLAAAHGVATAQAHLARVHGVRAALSDPDDDVRLPARLRVAEALQAIGVKAECRFANGERQFVLNVLGGGRLPLAAWRFDGTGALLGEFDLVAMAEALADTVSPDDMRRYIAANQGGVAGLDAATRKAAAAVMRRRAKKLDEPEHQQMRERAAQNFD